MPSPLTTLATAIATALGTHSGGWGIPFTVREVVIPVKSSKDCEDLELLVWLEPDGEDREQFSKSQIKETAFINISVVQRVESLAAFRGLIEFSEKVMEHRLTPVIAGESVWAHTPGENRWLQRYNPFLIQQDEEAITGEFVSVIALAFRRVI
jgi:hypothetical protein